MGQQQSRTLRNPSGHLQDASRDEETGAVTDSPKTNCCPRLSQTLDSGEAQGAETLRDAAGPSEGSGGATVGRSHHTTPLLRATSAAAALATGNPRGGASEPGGPGEGVQGTIGSPGLTYSRFHLMQIAAGRPLDAVTIVETVYGRMVGLGAPAPPELSEARTASCLTVGEANMNLSTLQPTSYPNTFNAALPAVEPPVLVLDESSEPVAGFQPLHGRVVSNPPTTVHESVPVEYTESDAKAGKAQSAGVQIARLRAHARQEAADDSRSSASPESSEEAGALSVSLPSSPQLSRISSWRKSQPRDHRFMKDGVRYSRSMRHQSSSLSLRSLGRADTMDDEAAREPSLLETGTPSQSQTCFQVRSEEESFAGPRTVSEKGMRAALSNNATGMATILEAKTSMDPSIQAEQSAAISAQLESAPPKTSLGSPLRSAPWRPADTATGSKELRVGASGDGYAPEVHTAQDHALFGNYAAYAPDATFSFATAIPVSVATLYFADPDKRGIFYEKSLASILHKWQRFREECRRDLTLRSRTRLRALKAAALFSTSVVKSRGILTLKSVRRCVEHVDVRRIYLGQTNNRAQIGPEAATSLDFDTWNDTEGDPDADSASSDNQANAEDETAEDEEEENPPQQQQQQQQQSSENAAAYAAGRVMQDLPGSMQHASASSSAVPAADRVGACDSHQDDQDTRMSDDESDEDEDFDESDDERSSLEDSDSTSNDSSVVLRRTPANHASHDVAARDQRSAPASEAPIAQAANPASAPINLLAERTPQASSSEAYRQMQTSASAQTSTTSATTTASSTTARAQRSSATGRSRELAQSDWIQAQVKEVERLERRANRWQLYTIHKLLPWGEDRICDKFDQFDLGAIRRTRSWPTMDPHDASAHVDHTALMAGTFIERQTAAGFEHFDLTEAAISLEAAARMLRHDIVKLAEIMEDNDEERKNFSVWLLRLATGGRIRNELQTPETLQGLRCANPSVSSAEQCTLHTHTQNGRAPTSTPMASASLVGASTRQLMPAAVPPGACLDERSTMRSAEDEIQSGNIVDMHGIAAVLRMLWEDCIDVFEADFANRRHDDLAFPNDETTEAFRRLLDNIVDSFSPAASLSVSHRDSRHFLTTEEFMSLADLLTRMYVRQKNRMECVGRYEIGRLLGRGSEGRVHVARDIYTGRRYAIKMIRRGKFVEFARIDREVQAMQVVARHPNVIHLHEVLESRRNVYLVMELCGGGSVYEFAYARLCRTSEQLDRNKPEPLLDEAEVRFLVRRLVETVAFCHAHGVSHRDLRLNNLMLLDSGELKIADFGQVGLFSAGWDMFETNLVGSLYNLAPELVQGQVYQSTKVDVWSCGVILYWLLEGHPPFPEEDLNRLIPAIVQCRYAPMRLASPLAQDLIRRILVPPAERPEAAALLAHPFFTGVEADSPAAADTTPKPTTASAAAAGGMSAATPDGTVAGTSTANAANALGYSRVRGSDPAWERPLQMDVRDFALCDASILQSIEADGGSLALQTMSSVLSDGDIHFHPGLCVELHRRYRWTLRCYWPEHDIKFSVALVAGPPRDDDGYLCCCGGEFQYHRRAFASRAQRPPLVYTLSFRRRGGGSLLFMRAVCKIADRFYQRYRRLLQTPNRWKLDTSDQKTLPVGVEVSPETNEAPAGAAVGIAGGRGSLESRLNPSRFSRPVRRLLYRLHLSSAASRRGTPSQAQSPTTNSGAQRIPSENDDAV
jgi:hypothetical protein